MCSGDRRAWGVRWRRLHAALCAAEVDAAVFILGIDSRHSSACLSFACYLLPSLQHTLRNTDVLDDCVFIVHTTPHLQLHVIAPPSASSTILAHCQHLPGFQLHACAARGLPLAQASSSPAQQQQPKRNAPDEDDTDDEEAIELFKILSFVSLLRDKPRVAVPLGGKPCDVLEGWPLVQASAAEDFGAGGFFTLTHDVMDLSTALPPLQAACDADACRSVIASALPAFTAAWSAVHSALARAAPASSSPAPTRAGQQDAIDMTDVRAAFRHHVQQAGSAHYTGTDSTSSDCFRCTTTPVSPSLPAVATAVCMDGWLPGTPLRCKRTWLLDASSLSPEARDATTSATTALAACVLRNTAHIFHQHASTIAELAVHAHTQNSGAATRDVDETEAISHVLMSALQQCFPPSTTIISPLQVTITRLSARGEVRPSHPSPSPSSSATAERSWAADALTPNETALYVEVTLPRVEMKRDSTPVPSSNEDTGQTLEAREGYEVVLHNLVMGDTLLVGHCTTASSPAAEAHPSPPSSSSPSSSLSSTACSSPRTSHVRAHVLTSVVPSCHVHIANTRTASASTAAATTTTRKADPATARASAPAAAAAEGRERPQSSRQRGGVLRIGGFSLAFPGEPSPSSSSSSSSSAAAATPTKAAASRTKGGNSNGTHDNSNHSNTTATESGSEGGARRNRVGTPSAASIARRRHRPLSARRPPASHHDTHHDTHQDAHHGAAPAETTAAREAAVSSAASAGEASTPAREKASGGSQVLAEKATAHLLLPDGQQLSTVTAAFMSAKFELCVDGSRLPPARARVLGAWCAKLDTTFVAVFRVSLASTAQWLRGCAWVVDGVEGSERRSAGGDVNAGDGDDGGDGGDGDDSRQPEGCWIVLTSELNSQLHHAISRSVFPTWKADIKAQTLEKPPACVVAAVAVAALVRSNTLPSPFLAWKDVCDGLRAHPALQLEELVALCTAHNIYAPPSHSQRHEGPKRRHAPQVVVDVAVVITSPTVQPARVCELLGAVAGMAPGVIVEDCSNRATDVSSLRRIGQALVAHVHAHLQAVRETSAGDSGENSDGGSGGNSQGSNSKRGGAGVLGAQAVLAVQGSMTARDIVTELQCSSSSIVRVNVAAVAVVLTSIDVWRAPLECHVSPPLSTHLRPGVCTHCFVTPAPRTLNTQPPAHSQQQQKHGVVSVGDAMSLVRMINASAFVCHLNSAAAVDELLDALHTRPFTHPQCMWLRHLTSPSTTATATATAAGVDVTATTSSPPASSSSLSSLSSYMHTFAVDGAHGGAQTITALVDSLRDFVQSEDDETEVVVRLWSCSGGRLTTAVGSRGWHALETATTAQPTLSHPITTPLLPGCCGSGGDDEKRQQACALCYVTIAFPEPTTEAHARSVAHDALMRAATATTTVVVTQAQRDKINLEMRGSELPEGWYFTGHQYVSMEGSRQATHPLLEQRVEEWHTAQEKQRRALAQRMNSVSLVPDKLHVGINPGLGTDGKLGAPTPTQSHTPSSAPQRQSAGEVDMGQRASSKTSPRPPPTPPPSSSGGRRHVLQPRPPTARTQRSRNSDGGGVRRPSSRSRYMPAPAQDATAPPLAPPNASLSQETTQQQQQRQQPSPPHKRPTSRGQQATRRRQLPAVVLKQQP
ncbi:hypothetical protein PTSG_03960 [Salpingoeca rosetta]|uniref:DAAF9 N-terminal domain-containing protein n=1 Tax=Salpingoeca rosetta (strain ATCC 50818 / BSB-021) TaxID=946362 RepID=F2U7D5_SALR5|nr:uncharacterized protein PTSG_03960 [Salpingoeca rosetta]EGD83352.1 hypothetical protein PTSG_03960 [Salpingoeca rosetta]|eukprot:XP_004994856.1 hypothetical protein PTSG_03960 [Salpingoeca rosetta]